MMNSLISGFSLKGFCGITTDEMNTRPFRRTILIGSLITSIDREPKEVQTSLGGIIGETNFFKAFEKPFSSIGNWNIAGLKLSSE